MMRITVHLLSIVFLITMAPIAVAGDDLWEMADQAYNNNDNETGNRHLKRLIESDPGNIDLSIRCLKKIYERGDRTNIQSRWMRYVTKRIAGLERLGAISANSTLFREILSKGLEQELADRNLFEAAESYDDLAKRNPHDLYWQSTRARGHQSLNLPTTRDLFEELKENADPNHPDPWIRERWVLLSEILGSDFRKLPQPILKPLDGSPMPDLAPDDPDGRWQQIIEQPIFRVAGQADRLIGLALLSETIVPWRDMTGIVDPPLALDLHLRSFPGNQIDELRKIQERSLKREKVPSDFTNAKALSLFRRYPWSAGAHRILLTAANRELIAGHARAALRSFEDLLTHSEDPETLNLARTGKWIALSIVGDRNTLRKEIKATEPDTEMVWMNETVKAMDLGGKLLSSIPESTTKKDPLPIKELQHKHIQIPAVSPWFGGGHPGGSVVDMQIVGNDLLVSSRNHLALYPKENPNTAYWSQPRLPMNDDRARRGILPGYFLPEVKKNTIYTRWGFKAIPQGIAAFDLKSGKAKWLHDNFGLPENQQPKPTPIGDPVISDGLIYVLVWDSHGGQKVQLACIEEATQSLVWRTTIVQAGQSKDIIGNLEKARDVTRTFGNRITLKGGAIFANTNAGLIARCDPRDGRPDWIHYYNNSTPSAGNGALGSAPIVTDDLVICMTRDSGKIFALDTETGRLVWENSLMLGVECLGLFEESLLIRGQFSLAALELKTGNPIWYTKVPDRTVGRSHMVGSSVYMADTKKITEFDARSGNIINSREWDPIASPPLSYLIHENSLYVIGDKPAPGNGIAIAEPLNPNASITPTTLTSNLKRQWTLMRSDANVFRAPYDSSLANHAFILSDGLLECVEISLKGALVWRRFIDANQPAFQIINDRLLLLSGIGANRHATAFDGLSGKILWECDVPKEANTLLQCGDIGLMHDRRSVLFAFDPKTGQRLWERRVAFGHLTIPYWDGTSINVFQTSMGRAPWHLIIDPRSGQMITDYDVEIANQGGNFSDGKLIGKGYYEVSFNPVKARFFRLVMLSEVNGMGWSSAAELHVGGTDGKNLDRSSWKAHYTNSYETKSRMNTELKNVFDGDRSSWWHTQWLGGIPRHPHELQIDLGEESTFKSLRYLPAVIINNNGMIGEYELYASNNAEEWGNPIAKGNMVQRLYIDKADFFDGGVVIETRNRKGGPKNLYSYRLDGKNATRLADKHELITSKGKYILAMKRNEKNQEVFVVLRPDDSSYQFELGSGIPFDRNRIIIEGDRLCLSSHKVVIADLAAKRFVLRPDTQASPQDRHGFFVRTGENTLIKFFHAGNKGYEVISIDLNTGASQQSMIAEQIDQIRDLSPHHIDPSPRFERILLLRDDFGISAWSSAN